MKAQSTISYLLTYGTALVVLVVAGAALRNTALDSFRVRGAVGFENLEVYDFILESSNSPQMLKMELGNSFGRKITVGSLTLNNGTHETVVTIDPPVRISPGKTKTVEALTPHPMFEGKVGDSFELDVTVHYATDTGIVHNEHGHLRGWIELPSERPEQGQSPPVVSRLTPTSAQIDVATGFFASATDDVGVEECWLYWEGEKIGEMEGNESYGIVYAPQESGTFSAWANCSDEAGNWAHTPTEIEVVGDCYPPVVSGLTPVSVPLLEGTVFSASATDDVGVEKCWFYWDGEKMGAMSGEINYTFVYWPVSEGTHEAWANCSDEAGNWAHTPTNVSVEKNAGGVAMVSYYDLSAESTPRYRTLDGEWSEEMTASDVGASNRIWHTLAASPTRNEYVLGVQDHENRITVQVWDGEWGDALLLSDSAAGHAHKSFDLAYESVSGDAVVVYKSVDELPRYRVWNGSGWSGERNTRSMTPCVLKWVVLDPDPHSNQIVLATLDSHRNIFAQVWDGSAWSEPVRITGNAHSSSWRGFDLAHEGDSGDALIVYNVRNSGTPKFRVWNGESWSREGSAKESCKGGVAWIETAGDFSSDNIIMGVACASKDFNLQVWDGENWGENYEVDRLGSGNRKSFDVAFETSGEGMAVWGSHNQDTAKYVTWDGSWSAAQSCQSERKNPQWVKLVSDSQSDRIILGVLDKSADFNVQIWDGEDWGENAKMETESSFTSECFGMAYRNS